MKALSLTQPWATLVVTGEKQIETRSWKPSISGRIAIHASIKFPKETRELTNIDPFSTSLADHGIVNPELVNQIPLGSIVGTVEIIGCLPTDKIVSESVLYKEFLRQHGLDRLTNKERAFGNYSANRYGWFLKNPIRLQKPIPCKGALSLWTVPSEIEQQILEQIQNYEQN